VLSVFVVAAECSLADNNDMDRRDMDSEILSIAIAMWGVKNSFDPEV
jgi:hypothetical protein